MMLPACDNCNKYFHPDLMYEKLDGEYICENCIKVWLKWEIFYIGGRFLRGETDKLVYPKNEELLKKLIKKSEIERYVIKK